MNSLLKLFLLSVIICLLSSCAMFRRSHVTDEFREQLRADDIHQTSKQTVLLILVDGLSLSTLQDQLNAKHLPEIKKYFIENAGRYYVARTTFPSLTVSGIGSLLTERRVDQNGLYGNKIFKDSQLLDFESPTTYHKLNEIIQGNNIFARLKKKGLKTASFDYLFNSDATVHIKSNDTKVGLAILDKNYAYVDSKLIGSLEDLLNNTDSKLWPDFIFIHLIGVDLTIHDQGPKSPKVAKYLDYLDRQLSGVFRILTKVESLKKRKIMALLTSDHGADEKISTSINLQKTLQNIDPQIKVLNENRYLSFNFPKNWQQSQKSYLLRQLAHHPLVDITAHREFENIFIQSASLQTKLTYGSDHCKDNAFAFSIAPVRADFSLATSVPLVCPENLDSNLNQLYYPYFLSSLSYYFQSSDHPDAVIIPKPGVAFSDEYQGQHGGPTPQEIFVPLLIRNGNLSNSQYIPALWELLRFM